MPWDSLVRRVQGIKATSKGMVKGLSLFISTYVTADSKATELLQ